MKSKKILGFNNPLYLTLDNLIKRKEFFPLIVILCAYHHSLESKVLKKILIDFYDCIKSTSCLDAYVDVLSYLKNYCSNIPSMYQCITWLFSNYIDLEGGVNS